MKKLVLVLSMMLPAVSQAGFLDVYACLDESGKLYRFEHTTMVKDENGDMNSYFNCSVITEKGEEKCGKEIAAISPYNLRDAISEVTCETNMIDISTPKIAEARRLLQGRPQDYAIWGEVSLMSYQGDLQTNPTLRLTCAPEVAN
jgi:hypothetical protein